MIQININLSSKPFVNYRKFAVITASLLLILVGISYWNISHYRTVHSRKENINRVLADSQFQIEKLAKEEQEIRGHLQQPETTDFLDLVNYVNLLIKRRTFSWTRLLNDLEKLIPANVQVVSIRPKLIEKELGFEITANARDNQDYIQFISNLEFSGKFYRVNPLSEDISKTPGFVGKQISLEVKYKGQT
jgi:type IV pilus assembly protein PilN